jgi:hypothetical protein
MNDENSVELFGLTFRPNRSDGLAVDGRPLFAKLGKTEYFLFPNLTIYVVPDWNDLDENGDPKHLVWKLAERS